MGKHVRCSKEFKEFFLNKRCYFCDFNLKIHLHHIIPSIIGGFDEDDNLIPLCPNCHTTIHSKRIILQYSNGYYLMVNPKTNKIIKEPHITQIQYKRKCPNSSISIAISINKLEIKSGDISYTNSNKLYEDHSIILTDIGCGWMSLQLKDEKEGDKDGDKK